MLLAIGVVVWFVLGLWRAQSAVEQPDSDYVAAVVGILFVIAGPLGWLVR